MTEGVQFVPTDQEMTHQTATHKRTSKEKRIIFQEVRLNAQTPQNQGGVGGFDLGITDLESEFSSETCRIALKTTKRIGIVIGTARRVTTG